MPKALASPRRLAPPPAGARRRRVAPRRPAPPPPGVPRARVFCGRALGRCGLLGPALGPPSASSASAAAARGGAGPGALAARVDERWRFGIYGATRASASFASNCAFSSAAAFLAASSSSWTRRASASASARFLATSNSPVGPRPRLQTASGNLLLQSRLLGVRNSLRFRLRRGNASQARRPRASRQLRAVRRRPRAARPGAQRHQSLFGDDRTAKDVWSRAVKYVSFLAGGARRAPPTLANFR